MGELDALVEVTELAARSFTASSLKHKDLRTFIEHESKEHGVRVQMGEWKSWRHHLIGTYISIVYQSAEQFLRSFRREHEKLHDVPWKRGFRKKSVKSKKKRKKLDPLTAALRNIHGSEKHVGKDIISRFHYYRLLRNGAAHKGEKSSNKIQRQFSKIEAYSKENMELFKLLRAPNSPETLNFDDFILFSRIVKRVGEQLCSLSMPPKERWQFVVPFDRFRRSGNATRIQNAIQGWLRTEYGIDEATAKDIALSVKDPLA